MFIILFNKSSSLAAALDVTIGRFVEQKLPLSCSFKRDQIITIIAIYLVTLCCAT